MANYIQFKTGEHEDDFILIEVDEDEVDENSSGAVKVGLKELVEGTVSLAKKPFSTAIKNALRNNVEGLIESIHTLPDPPSEVEITFTLKATGEAGNVAIGKVGAESNYTVKLVWKKS